MKQILRVYGEGCEEGEGRGFKTSAEDFELYQESCEFWLDRFSLRRWDVGFVHGVAKQRPEAMAWCSYYPEGRVASLGLNRVWEIAPTPYAIQKAALHECLELVLADMGAILECRQFNPSEAEMTRHSIVRILEHILMEDMVEINHREEAAVMLEEEVSKLESSVKRWKNKAKKA